MNIFDILTKLQEMHKHNMSQKEVGKTKDYPRKVSAKKSRVDIYPSIAKALKAGSYGKIFSTTSANRLYVITKGKWGKKSGRGKIAKGFTPGSATPSADYSSIKGFSKRTKQRYGGE